MSEAEEHDTGSVQPGPEATWELVLANWDDPAVHKRFVTLCQATGALAFAGGQYRQVVNSADEREAVAREQIEAVIALAAADLFAHRPPKTRAASIARLVMTIVSAGALLYTVRMLLELL